MEEKKYFQVIYIQATLATLFLILAIFWQSPSLFNLLVAIFCGFLFWTLVEYLIHRFMEHPKNGTYIFQVWRLHKDHHRDPTIYKIANHTLSESFQIIPAITLFCSILLWNLYLIPSIYFGVTLGFLLYEWVHYSSHFVKKPHPLVRTMVNIHLDHHRMNIKANYGISTDLWDWVFGTKVPLGSKNSNS